MARSLAEVAALPDPDRRGDQLQPAAQRAGSQPGARSAGRHLHDLREPAQRDRRRRRALRQERQRGHPPRRQGGDPLQPGTAPVLADELPPCGLPEHAVQLVRTTDRAAVGHLLGLPEFIDLAIPRGGESLIRRVAAEAKMPVMKHYQGICTVYVDAAADPEMAIRIILNAKAQRPGVCNAAETLLVHRDIAPSFLPRAARALRDAGVELRGDADGAIDRSLDGPRASRRTGTPSSSTRSWRWGWSTRSMQAIEHIATARLGAHRDDRDRRPGRGPQVRGRGR